MVSPRAGLTIRGPHTNVRRIPFSHTRTQDFLSGCTFLPPPKKKVDDFFSRRNEAYTARSKRQHSVVKISQLIGAPPGGGRPPRMVQSAQWLIRPWVSPYFFFKKLTTFFSHRPLESDDLFSCRLLTTPIFPRRLSSVLSKFSHSKN